MSIKVKNYSSIKMLGDFPSYKNCYNSTEEHFICLDKFNDKLGNKLTQYFKNLLIINKDNHYKCPETYKIWTNNCEKWIRRHLMEDRDNVKRDNKLFTQKELDIYNEKSQKKVWSRPSYF